MLFRSIYNKTIAGEQITDDDLKTPLLLADKTIEPYKESPALFVLTINVFGKDSSLLFQKKELIKSSSNQK